VSWNRYRLGLVLSGGAIRGAAHIGVFRALRELSVLPDLICGSSAGAIAGALWSFGYSEEEMREATMTFDPFALWRTSWSGPAILDPSYFSEHWAQYLDRDLESGRVPVYVVATDVLSAEPVLMYRGPALPAIQASSALSPFWPPVQIGHRLLFDGGYSLNVPVEPVRSLCQTVIAVDVNPLNDRDEDCIRSSWRLFNRGLEISGRRSAERSLSLADVVIEPRDIHAVDPLDRTKVEQVERYGYEETLRQLAPYAATLRLGRAPIVRGRKRPRPQPYERMVVPADARTLKRRTRSNLTWWAGAAAVFGLGAMLVGGRARAQR